MAATEACIAILQQMYFAVRAVRAEKWKAQVAVAERAEELPGRFIPLVAAAGEGEAVMFWQMGH